MKKYLLIISLTLLIGLTLVACSTEEAVINTSESAKPTPIVVEEATKKITDVTTEEGDLGYGAVGSFKAREYTIEQMLIYAIQDEYLARSEYEYIINEMDGGSPFTNIINAEVSHISMLIPLFETYGFDLPVDTSGTHLIVPFTIIEAYETGVIAEVDNIAMYEQFLELDLPDDIRETFINLRDASEKHLDAFQRKLSR
ncbi:MAG: hypothetical protein KAG94_00240 [Clostridiales bacterium]|nr:hypothetical protein [Clostridiales bacterium]